jgi:hypothetical protein
MPKSIHTPRDELICGKIDAAEEIVKLATGSVPDAVRLLHLLASIRHDAERMEAKLASRKKEVVELEEDSCSACTFSRCPRES